MKRRMVLWGPGENRQGEPRLNIIKHTAYMHETIEITAEYKIHICEVGLTASI